MDNMIKWVIPKIIAKNPEYTPNDIKTMAETALWQHKVDNQKSLYFLVLKRILEEKGYIYRENKFYKPLVSMGDNVELYTDYYKIVNKEFQTILSTVLSQAKLTDDELFVLGCKYRIEPEFKSLTIKAKFESIPPYCDEKKMTNKNIGELIDKTPQEVTKLSKEAIKKMEQICADSRLSRPKRNCPRHSDSSNGGENKRTAF